VPFLLAFKILIWNVLSFELMFLFMYMLFHYFFQYFGLLVYLVLLVFPPTLIIWSVDIEGDSPGQTFCFHKEIEGNLCSTGTKNAFFWPLVRRATPQSLCWHTGSTWYCQSFGWGLSILGQFVLLDSGVDHKMFCCFVVWSLESLLFLSSLFYLS
jgi:hypothetical protein